MIKIYADKWNKFKWWDRPSKNVTEIGKAHENICIKTALPWQCERAITVCATSFEVSVTLEIYLNMLCGLL